MGYDRSFTSIHGTKINQATKVLDDFRISCWCLIRRENLGWDSENSYGSFLYPRHLAPVRYEQKEMSCIASKSTIHQPQVVTNLDEIGW
jgi:hypothetical protein